MDTIPQDANLVEESSTQPCRLNIETAKSSDCSTTIPESPQATTSSPNSPLHRSAFDEPSSKVMDPSLPPSGYIDGLRQAGSPPPRLSGLTSDIAAKMKAFSLSRQGAPGQSKRPAPGPGHTMSTSGGLPTTAFPTGTIPHGETQQRNGSLPPNGPLAAGAAALRLPPSLARPKPPNWNSSPQMVGPEARTANPRSAMGGLAAKRGIKGGGMKLSDATGPPQSPSAGGADSSVPPASTTASAFNKYADLIDTKRGTLNFQNKAMIHGGGIDFTSGTSFSISLDEVDTMGELGKGNYGTVYKVRHTRPKIRRPGQGLRGNMATTSPGDSLSRSSSQDSSASAPAAAGSGVVMAMKEIRLELDDAKFAAIIMELDILHRCVSPFIVSFYGAFFQEGSVYICLEFMDGGSVDKLYGDGIPEAILKKIALSTVVGLRFLKDEHNIIHRDVKPTNILVNTRGQVKICDFGVSGNLVASIAKTNIGCQSYMAPERISGGGVAQAGANPGGGTYSVQSDVWSLGLTIVECALGRYPYAPETYNNIFSQLSAIVDGDPPDLPSSGYSEAARAFVSSCLHKTPKMRPTYAMLMRHAWLAPLLKPPPISEEEEDLCESPTAAGAQTQADENSTLGEESSGAEISHPETADREVAEWARSALHKKLSQKLGNPEKPALHAAPLDRVIDSPVLERGVLNSDSLESVKPAVSLADPTRTQPGGQSGKQDEDPTRVSPGVVVTPSVIAVSEGKLLDEPKLNEQNVESMDFAAEP